MDKRPLIVALDRALSLADTRPEAQLLRLTRGTATRTGDLPLNPAVVDMMHHHYAAGHAVYLLAEETTIAAATARRLGPGFGLIVPDADRGETRVQAIDRVLGQAAFDFVGNGREDAPVFQAAQTTFAVGQPPADTDRTAILLPGPPDGVPVRALWRAMRPHHWVKNLLVLLPLIAAHRWADPAALAGGLFALVVFCLASSAVYLTNDMFDLDDDRNHPNKCHRPLASGQLDLRAALAAAGGLGLLALGLAFALDPTPAFAALTAVYTMAALAYSVWLKTWRFADLISLAALYALRVLAGGAAEGIAVSWWLIGLSLALFTSLASAKRCAELALALRTGGAGIARRGYRADDRLWVKRLGGLSALGAGLLLLAYAAGPQAAELYTHPGLLVIGAIGLMLWLGRIWQKLAPGHAGTDPILFALRDPVCWALVAAMTAAFARATV